MKAAYPWQKSYVDALRETNEKLLRALKGLGTMKNVILGPSIIQRSYQKFHSRAIGGAAIVTELCKKGTRRNCLVNAQTVYLGTSRNVSGFVTNRVLDLNRNKFGFWKLPGALH
jgi:hypothetical protein